MKLGKVVGYVVSTRKTDNLLGGKLLIVRDIVLSEDAQRLVESDQITVAVDTVGAGVGETVLMTMGTSSTKYVPGFEKFPTDCTITGIVDSAELDY